MGCGCAPAAVGAGMVGDEGVVLKPVAFGAELRLRLVVIVGRADGVCGRERDSAEECE